MPRSTPRNRSTRFLKRILRPYIDVQDCYDVAQAIDRGLPSLRLHYDAGYFINYKGKPADHAWVKRADGAIIDTTHGQFDPKIPILIAKKGTAVHGRYRSWDEHHNPDCLMRKLKVKDNCEAPGCGYKGDPRLPWGSGFV